MSTIIHSLNLVRKRNVEPYAFQVGNLSRVLKHSGIVDLSNGVVQASFSGSSAVKSRVSQSNGSVSIIGVRDEWEFEARFNSWEDLIKIFENLEDARFSRLHASLGPPSSPIVETIMGFQNEGEFVAYDRWTLLCDDFIFETETDDVLIGRFGLSLSGYCSSFAIVNREIVNAVRALDSVSQLERELVDVTVRDVGGGGPVEIVQGNLIDAGEWCWFWEEFD